MTYAGSDVSVIIVSDYEAGEKTWEDERRSIAAFLAPGEMQPSRIVVMEYDAPGALPPVVPSDIAARSPLVEVHFAPFQHSAPLKDAALPYATTPLVAVVEADCLPEPGWLEALVSAFNRQPDLEIVSGRTSYGPGGPLRRVAELLDRGLMERTRNGNAIHVSVNGALYRRKMLEQYPFPPEPNPFIAAELRLRHMHEDGIRLGVEPKAVIRHAFHGVPFMIDMRRNKGFQGARILAAKAEHRDASILRLAWLSVIRSARDDGRSVRALGGERLRWWDWPLLLATFLAVRIPEFAGGLAARTPERFEQSTSYR